jgi:hypothetical protein
MSPLWFATLMLLPACLGWMPANPMTNGMLQLQKTRGCQSQLYSYRTRRAVLPVMQASFGRWAESDVARKRSSDDSSTVLAKKAQIGSFLKAIKKPKGTICERKKTPSYKPGHNNSQLLPPMYSSILSYCYCRITCQIFRLSRKRSQECLFQPILRFQSDKNAYLQRLLRN